MDNNLIANLKKDIYTAVISNGSLEQKNNAIKISEDVFQWCVKDLGQEKSPKFKTK